MTTNVRMNLKHFIIPLDFCDFYSDKKKFSCFLFCPDYYHSWLGNNVKMLSEVHLLV